jgi:opacity protein-like surface antigen
MKTALLGTAMAVGMAMAGGSAYAADLMHGVESATSVPAASGLYISVFGGIVAPSQVDGQYYGSSDLDLQTQTGFLLGAAVGTHVTSNLRAEFELSWAHHGVSDDDFMYAGWCGTPGACGATGGLSTLYMLGNVWYDMDIGSGFTPYVGGGVGAAVVMPDITLYGDSSDVWNDARLAGAAQLGLGVKWDISDNMTLDLGYRAKAVFGGVLAATDSCNNACSATGVTYIDHTVQAGLTMGF